MRGPRDEGAGAWMDGSTHLLTTHPSFNASLLHPSITCMLSDPPSLHRRKIRNFSVRDFCCRRLGAVVAVSVMMHGSLLITVSAPGKRATLTGRPWSRETRQVRWRGDQAFRHVQNCDSSARSCKLGTARVRTHRL